MASQEFPLKKSNVSYSNNKTTKSAVVPLLDVKYRFGTKLSDPVWKKAVWIDDFEPFKKARVDKKSEMALFRTAGHLVIGLFFHESPENITRPESIYSNPWTGDLVEIIFGDMEPDPWLWQIAVGVTGIRFDSSGNYDKWQVKGFETEEGWGVEVRLDLSAIRLTEGGFRFNVCRQALARRELSTWSPLQIRFHEVENFGELLFVDYNTALHIKCGKVVPETLSQKRYEQLRRQYMIPAQKVVFGPFLSAPDTGSVRISWETAGLVPSYLEYWKKGCPSDRIRVESSKLHGVLEHNSSHDVRLTGLEPGSEYEYEIFTMKPVLLTPESTGIKRSFEMPAKDKNKFSFFCITDIHSDVGYISRALSLPEFAAADFTVLLGDNLSHAAGAEALYKGVTSPVNSQSADCDKDRPLVFVRGNHEQLGVYAKEFFKVMGHPCGESFYTFSWGTVFFIVLDSGGDTLGYDDSIMFSNRLEREKQRRFLEETVKCESYLKAEFRVVLMHIPPTKNIPESVSTELYRMTEPLRMAELTPDAVICGHLHAYEKVNANEDHYAPETASEHAVKFPQVHRNPYPVITHVNTAGLVCEVGPDEMILSVTDVSNSEKPELIDRIKVKKQSALSKK